MLNNALYSAGQVQAVACKLPDIALQTQRGLQQYSVAYLDCLQRAWKPLVDRTDSLLTPPGLHTVNQGARTGCGVVSDDDEAFYCGENTGIYLDWDVHVEEEPGDRMEAGTYLQYVIAHEFGHHLQHMVGISTQFDLRLEEGTEAAQLEQTRRHELQASCFAAAFLGANQRTLDLHGIKLEVYQWAAYTGDDDPPAGTRDHGSRKSNTAWTNAGFKAKSPAACNTWVVSSGRVS
nr:neutral zinc metallopeptidase [Kribbella shirazensis]